MNLTNELAKLSLQVNRPGGVSSTARPQDRHTAGGEEREGGHGTGRAGREGRQGGRGAGSGGRPAAKLTTIVAVIVAVAAAAADNREDILRTIRSVIGQGQARSGYRD